MIALYLFLMMASSGKGSPRNDDDAITAWRLVIQDENKKERMDLYVYSFPSHFRRLQNMMKSRPASQHF